jgi:hypothetical protein
MTDMMMIPMLLVAALGASGGDPAALQDGEDGASDLSAFAMLRSGVWAGTGFRFDSTHDSVRREINTNALFSAGVDAGVEFSKHFVLFGTYEVNLAEDIFCDIAGACLGYRERAEEGTRSTIPVETTVYAGGIWGRFDVNAEGYKFDDAVGFRAGMAFSWKVSRSLTVDLVGEYRLIEFNCTEKPDSGDNQIGGSSGWLGLGLKLTF